MTPAEHFGRKVIGTARTKDLELVSGSGEKRVLPGQEYDVISIGSIRERPCYITNTWHKEHRFEPLVLIEDIVESFTPTEVR